MGGRSISAARSFLPVVVANCHLDGRQVDSNSRSSIMGLNPFGNLIDFFDQSTEKCYYYQINEESKY